MNVSLRYNSKRKEDTRMDQFEFYLQYQKELTESKLKIINRFQKGVKPKLKRTSKIEIAKNVLHIAGCPLHVSEIIQLAKRDFEVELDRDSIVSAILKKVNAGKSFIRTSPNTFALKEPDVNERGRHDKQN